MRTPNWLRRPNWQELLAQSLPLGADLPQKEPTPKPYLIDWEGVGEYLLVWLYRFATVLVIGALLFALVKFLKWAWYM